MSFNLPDGCRDIDINMAAYDEPEPDEQGCECGACREIKQLKSELDGYKIRERMATTRFQEIADEISRGDIRTAYKLAIGECPF